MGPPPSQEKMSDEEAWETPSVRTNKEATQDAKKPPNLMDLSRSQEMSDEETPSTAKRARQDAKKLTKGAKNKCSQVVQIWAMDNLELLTLLISSSEEAKTDMSDLDRYGQPPTRINVY